MSSLQFVAQATSFFDVKLEKLEKDDIDLITTRWLNGEGELFNKLNR
ncbi:hypothetical protein BVSY1_32190 [Bacillus velezensis]|nr:hypothetical protein BVSY1_32190 [Bacillus velezensis]